MNEVGGPVEEYFIIDRYTISDLSYEVNKMIKDGWQPQGGITTITEYNSYKFYQPMVKQKNKQ